MPSYSNRPQYGEPQALGSSDFEAVSYDNNGYENNPYGYDNNAYGHNPYAPIPRAPRSPSFTPAHMHQGHQLAQTGPFRPGSGPHYPQMHGNPHGNAQMTARGGSMPPQMAPASSGRHGIPGAPNSLSPVAMASARNAVATGPQMAQAEPFDSPARPSAKAGMSILFAGAIIGGLVGAVMHARQNAAEAFASAAAPTHEVAPADTGPAPLASSSNALPSNVIAPPSKDDAKKDDAKKDDAKAEAKVKKARRWVAWSGPKTTPMTTTGSVSKKDDADDTTDATPAPTTKKGKKSNKDDDGYTIASADGSGGSSDDDATPAPAPKKDPPPKADNGKKKTATAKDDAPKAPKASTAKGGDDAVNVLKEAMGATANSL